jgi:hypothetical protein
MSAGMEYCCRYDCVGGETRSRNIADRTAVAGIGSTNLGALYPDLDAECTPYDMGAGIVAEGR